jgi:hypothetical protein
VCGARAGGAGKEEGMKLALISRGGLGSMDCWMDCAGVATTDDKVSLRVKPPVLGDGEGGVESFSS